MNLFSFGDLGTLAIYRVTVSPEINLVFASMENNFFHCDVNKVKIRQ